MVACIFSPWCFVVCRGRFEVLCASFIQQCLHAVTECLNKSEINRSDIHKVCYWHLIHEVWHWCLCTENLIIYYLLSFWEGMKMVHFAPLRKTLTSPRWSSCASCYQQGHVAVKLYSNKILCYRDFLLTLVVVLIGHKKVMVVVMHLFWRPFTSFCSWTVEKDAREDCLVGMTMINQLIYD